MLREEEPGAPLPESVPVPNLVSVPGIPILREPTESASASEAAERSGACPAVSQAPAGSREVEAGDGWGLAWFGRGRDNMGQWMGWGVVGDGVNAQFGAFDKLAS